MIQLQEKVYTKAEIAGVLGLNIKDSHFKRNVENTLTKWGYQYEYPPYSKTITITYVPEGEDKLAEILIREYSLDVQIDSAAFACFIHAFNNVDSFYSMPWGERANMLQKVYGVEVCEKTLRNWANKLLSAGTLAKSDFTKTYWKSAKISQKETLREQTTKEEYIKYYKYKSEQYKANIANLITTGNEDFYKVKAEAYKLAHYAAMNKFGGWCFYSCKALMLSSFDEKSLVEVMEIVEDIAPSFAEYKAQLDVVEAEQRAEANKRVQEEIARITKDGGFIF